VGSGRYDSSAGQCDCTFEVMEVIQMKHSLIGVAILAAGGLWGAANLVAAPPSPQATGSAATATADRDATQKIRKAIMDNKGLSTYAHNVKINTLAGKVTLRGPVRSEDEKKAVADAAASVVGAENVTNELTVQPPK
jgi:osmotically-inducible protein OsmY